MGLSSILVWVGFGGNHGRFFADTSNTPPIYFTLKQDRIESSRIPGGKYLPITTIIVPIISLRFILLKISDI
jgi:hypothetical protein